MLFSRLFPRLGWAPLCSTHLGVDGVEYCFCLWQVVIGAMGRITSRIIHDDTPVLPPAHTTATSLPARLPASLPACLPARQTAWNKSVKLRKKHTTRCAKLSSFKWSLFGGNLTEGAIVLTSRVGNERRAVGVLARWAEAGVRERRLSPGGREGTGERERGAIVFFLNGREDSQPTSRAFR